MRLYETVFFSFHIWRKVGSILSLNKMLLCYKHPQRLNHFYVFVMICICPKADPTILCIAFITNITIFFFCFFQVTSLHVPPLLPILRNNLANQSISTKRIFQTFRGFTTVWRRSFIAHNAKIFTTHL